MAVDEVTLTSSLIAMLARADLPDHPTEEDVQARLADVLSAAVGVLGVDGVGLMLLDEDDVLRVVGVTDAPAAALEQAQLRAGTGPGIDCVRGRTTVAVADLAHSAEYRTVWEQLAGRSGAAIGSVLSAPVQVRGETVGTLNALHHAPQRWDDAQVRSVQAYAAVIGILLRLEAASANSSRIPIRRPPER
jgi:GAF domain-containing protein